MAKPPSTEDALAAIHAIRQTPEKHDLKRDLAPFLRHKSNHVVAAAAATVERLEASALAPDPVSYTHLDVYKRQAAALRPAGRYTALLFRDPRKSWSN